MKRIWNWKGDVLLGKVRVFGGKKLINVVYMCEFFKE